MDKSRYTLWTGAQAPATSDEDWEAIVANASVRLASFLCLQSLPDPLPSTLEELLANFIAAVQKRRGGDARVSSKRVRNFTINFDTDSAANAFSEIAESYGDVIAMYSECDMGIAVEKTVRPCCYGRF